MAHHFTRQGVLAAIEEQVHFARRRFGRYEVIDFLAVLFGYAISGERTLESFYERIEPWASAFMALFGRDRRPSRSTLSRFLAALNQAAVEDLRASTTVLQAQTHQWLDGQYGTGAVLSDLVGLAYVMRGKDYQVLERAEVQARLRLLPDQQPTCGLCGQHPQLPSLSCARAVSMEWQSHSQASPGECAAPPSPRRLCSLASSVTGAEDGIGMYACNCYPTNASRSWWTRACHPLQRRRLSSSLARSGRTIVSRGKSG